MGKTFPRAKKATGRQKRYGSESNRSYFFPFFRYVINNECLSVGEPPWSLIIVVTSKTSHVELRKAQREAFPQYLLRRANIKRVFLLARDDQVDQESVEEENMRHRDIVQANFSESYRNLAYKHIMGLQWAVNYCKNSRYLIHYSWPCDQ